MSYNNLLSAQPDLSSLSSERSIAIHRFLMKKCGLQQFKIEPIMGDCSKRIYWRIYIQIGSFILMDSSLEVLAYHDFIHVANWLLESGIAAPRIIAADPCEQLLLLEDLGTTNLKDYLIRHPDEEEQRYRQAIDVLAYLHQQKVDISLPPYDINFLNKQLTEFVDVYLTTLIDPPLLHLAQKQLLDNLNSMYKPLLSVKPVVVLRDYHSENLLVTDEGLSVIDFQDARMGCSVYDLMSLMQDARRTVSIVAKNRGLDYYYQANPVLSRDQFDACYMVLSAHHALRLLALFNRLIGNGFVKYGPCFPRVLSYLQYNLTHPHLQPLLDWVKRYELLPRFYNSIGASEI